MDRTIAILGASGFIGQRLVSELLCESGYEIRVMCRDLLSDSSKERFGNAVKVFEGDASDPDSLREFLVPGCVVVNLVYLWSAGEAANLACIHSLLTACTDKKVARLIHCSTAAVVGRVPADTVNEETRCCPIDQYGLTKLKVEQAIINLSKGHFDAVILRPTSVFGIDGEPLKKLAGDITGGSTWKNYIKSCLFNGRRMHLVPLANVVAAIVFLIRGTECFEGAIFIASNDDEPLNNFRDVEKFLMAALGVNDYQWPRLPIPLNVLKLLLLLLGRSNVNPSRNFDAGKLRSLGFNNPRTLLDGLEEYAAWYRRAVLGDKVPENL
jgi:nucleoside-diphosphate-sugar epimerase